MFMPVSDSAQMNARFTGHRTECLFKLKTQTVRRGTEISLLNKVRLFSVRCLTETDYEVLYYKRF